MASCESHGMKTVFLLASRGKDRVHRPVRDRVYLLRFPNWGHWRARQSSLGSGRDGGDDQAALGQAIVVGLEYNRDQVRAVANWQMEWLWAAPL